MKRMTALVLALLLALSVFPALADDKEQRTSGQCK